MFSRTYGHYCHDRSYHYCVIYDAIRDIIRSNRMEKLFTISSRISNLVVLSITVILVIIATILTIHAKSDYCDY